MLENMPTHRHRMRGLLAKTRASRCLRIGELLAKLMLSLVLKLHLLRSLLPKPRSCKAKTLKPVELKRVDFTSALLCG